GAARHNLRKPETDSPLELAFNRKRIDRQAAVYGHRNAMNLEASISDRNFTAHAHAVLLYSLHAYPTACSAGSLVRQFAFSLRKHCRFQLFRDLPDFGYRVKFN